MARRRRATTAELTTKDGDVCDSLYERIIIDNLIERGVPYEFHPGPYEYSRPVRAGFCSECDSNSVRKGAMYTPDLLLPSTGIIVELKGGSMTQEGRGRLKDFCRTCDFVLHFMFRYPDKPIKTGSKTRQRRWAERMNCVVGGGMSIPEEWV